MQATAPSGASGSSTATGAFTECTAQINYDVMCGVYIAVFIHIPQILQLIQPIIGCRNRGKHHYIVIIAEGVGGTMEIADQIKSITGISTTTTILGHLQRGGSPTVRDRVAASLMAVKATEALQAGERNQIIAVLVRAYIAVFYIGTSA